jgi:hypothetical protein
MLTPGDPLQFERAEYTSVSSGPVCCTCKQPAAPEYHQFNGRVFCTNCRQQIEHSIGQLHQSGNMGQAFLFGLGAAILGSVIFYAVSALTGYQLGLIGVLVGYLVGKAVRKGSGSAGGRQYQVLAVSLTYASIAATYVPGHGISALAAPLLGGFQNILGLVIIGIALWQAWKMNRRVEVKFTGPFFARAVS